MLLMVSIMGCYSPPPLRTGLEGSKLPAFNLLLTDSTTVFNTGALDEGKPVVFFYFSPTCPYCKAQMEYIINDIKNLSDIEFCILTYAPISEANKYSEEYKLKRFPNMIVGQDYTSFFLEYFKSGTVPFLAIYDSKKILKQVVAGNIKTKSLRAIINE